MPGEPRQDISEKTKASSYTAWDWSDEMVYKVTLFQESPAFGRYTKEEVKALFDELVADYAKKGRVIARKNAPLQGRPGFEIIYVRDTSVMRMWVVFGQKSGILLNATAPVQSAMAPTNEEVAKLSTPPINRFMNSLKFRQ